MSDELRRLKSLLDEMTETAEHRMFTVFWLLLDNMKDIDVTCLREDMSARIQAIAETKNTTFDEFQVWLDIERERRTAVLKRFSDHVTKTTNGESDGGDVMCLASCGKCVLKEGWASYNSQDYNTGSLPTTARSVVDLLAFTEDCIRHCTKTVEEYGLSEVGVGSINDELPAKIASLLSSCKDVIDALQHTRGRLLAGELTVTCMEEDVMGCGEGETKKGREEADRPIGVCSGNGATLGKDAPAPHVLLACSDVAALKSHHEMDSGPRVCDCGRPFMSLRTLNSHRARACPAVADEGAQRQENDAAQDPGPSNIGATNLAGDESEDAGAEDDANGAAGDNAELAAQPVEPFDSSRRLAVLIFSARGGVGMSHTDVDALLSLLKDPRFSETDIAYRNSRECFAWAGSLAEAAGWKELDLRSDDWPREAHAVLWHRDWRTAFLSIMHVALQKCETVHSLEVSPPSEDNSVSGPHSGALSYHTQSIIRAHKGDDENGYSRYVIPLSLYSDKTHTDGRQKQTAYPLMMSLADHASEATLLVYLPVLHHRPRDKGRGLQSTAFRRRKAVIFHKALSTVLQAAKEASHDGITIPSTRFGDVTVHLFLLNYIQDYPERCVLANVKFGVCPTCTVSKTDLDVVADFTDSRRSQTLETQLAAAVFTVDDDDVRRAAEGRMAEFDMHRHVEQNGLWGFYRGPSGDDPQLDYHLALQPDRMHTIEHGIFLHMIDAFRAATFEKLSNTPQTEILKELDARLQCISERCTRTYPQLVLLVATGSDFFSREGRFEANILSGVANMHRMQAGGVDSEWENWVVMTVFVDAEVPQQRNVAAMTILQAAAALPLQVSGVGDDLDIIVGGLLHNHVMQCTALKGVQERVQRARQLWVLERSRRVWSDMQMSGDRHDRVFRRLCRLPRPLFLETLKRIEPHIQRQDTNWRRPLPAALKFAYTLDRWTMGTYYRQYGHSLGVGLASAQPSNVNVADACIQEYGHVIR
ncbi:hypothetical protein CBR_g19750 [Chara braunii]|uniref:C2H2-type domain-containing protein n=1 Tax=Chara braunii TaxID=69332 RepID=A0A388JTX1_CHABU|nr:hypothetical protein CBR_g19750 [Chara braunii]|eukprot:GBG61217.1 hypothetical protein CBR_g19750 [Chara braunii]